LGIPPTDSIPAFFQFALASRSNGNIVPDPGSGGGGGGGGEGTALPVNTLLPVIVFVPSLIETAIVKLLIKFVAGVKITPASSAFTLAIAPEALQTPVLPL
jgi:hypothetical protein